MSTTTRPEEKEERTLAEFQDAIRDELIKLSGCDRIDGAGCESGDPLDFTLTEIRQAFAHVQDRAPASSSASVSDEQVAREAAIECMISAYGFYNGGSAGASEAMTYARYNQQLPGLKHVSEERFLPVILSAITKAKAAAAHTEK